MMPHVTFAPLKEFQPRWFPALKTPGELRDVLHELCARLGLVSAAIYHTKPGKPDYLSSPAVYVVANEALHTARSEIDEAVALRFGTLMRSPDNAWLMDRAVDGRNAGQALVQCGSDGSGGAFVFVLHAARGFEETELADSMAVIHGLLANPLARLCGVEDEASAEPHHALSARERECLSWTAEGKTSEEIAIILELSVHTVNHYLTSAARKLNAVNRLHAVARAIRIGLLEDVDLSEHAAPVPPKAAMM